MEGINWSRLYGILEDITPLSGDCGGLCGKKCCSLKEEVGRGVLLFPGEEAMFTGEAAWCAVEEFSPGAENFTGGSYILNCRGTCPREKRPLACRLFPMVPYLGRQGGLEIIADPDALFICPLVRLNETGALEAQFLEGVRRVWLDLLGNSALGDVVRRYSARLDREREEPWRKLLG